MGIFGALTTAVTGLRAQSYALENISGNIANSQTTAYKRVDTSFEDLIADNPPSKQLAGTVTAFSRSTNTVQGDIQNASVATFMAINGDGFFAVQKPSSFTDGQPAFDGVTLYTRRGDFQPDKNGYLVNGAGYYLMGNPVDATTGNVTGSVPQVLKFQNNLLPAQETTTIQYQVNLPSYPLTPAHDTAVPDSELLDGTLRFLPSDEADLLRSRHHGRRIEEIEAEYRDRLAREPHRRRGKVPSRVIAWLLDVASPGAVDTAFLTIKSDLHAAAARDTAAGAIPGRRTSPLSPSRCPLPVSRSTHSLAA